MAILIRFFLLCFTLPAFAAVEFIALSYHEVENDTTPLTSQPHPPPSAPQIWPLNSPGSRRMATSRSASMPLLQPATAARHCRPKPFC
jgi:hypothetical protein